MSSNPTDPTKHSPQWILDVEDIKNLKFSSLEKCETNICNWALENEFVLVKDTSAKSYALYLKCSRSGKPRKFANAEGKRKKPSKKTGNFIFS